MAHSIGEKGPLWRLEDVGFSYGNTAPVLAGIDLELYQGRIYGVLGPNGSGKTTLLDLLCGLNKPCRGTVLFDSHRISHWNRRELAGMIAVVPQEFHLRFSFTVQEAVEMGLHPHISRFASPTRAETQRVKRVMELLDISHLAKRRVTQLSGGEKQRVATARALVQARKALLLDEATSNLDIFHSLSILSVIKEMASDEGLCVVAAVHDINLASFFCDEFIFLHHGTVAACGEPGKILDATLLRKIYGLDAEVRFDSFTNGIAVSFRMP